MQLELTIETSLLYKIVPGNLVVPIEAALLLVSIFGSRLDDYEHSCSKYLHPWRCESALASLALLVSDSLPCACARVS